MFNNSSDIRIKDGLFITATNIIIGDNNDSLEILYKNVAPNAILNAGVDVDSDFKCHPGTRTEIIDLIEKWMLGPHNTSDCPIFWLSGPAGAGKTSIVHTVAERCKEQGVPHANFFFFRADGSRCSPIPLVPTLLHQIIQFYPDLRRAVSTILSCNPLIVHASLEDQFFEPLVIPLRAIQQSSHPYHPMILLIDGLDECDPEIKIGQRQILRAIDKVLVNHHGLFRVLVASHAEHQIAVTFNLVATPVLPLYLDDQYSPEKDIRLFVDDKFEDIRRSHRLAHMLDETWPPIEDIKSIVEKSSGQFIYAATVMRFILDSSASPQLSLERVQGVTPLAIKSPFSHLDAMYSYILSRADDQEALKDILHAQLLGRMTHRDTARRTTTHRNATLQQILQMYNPRYTDTVLHSCVADLTAIAHLGCRELSFYHASLPEYLQDESRSGTYFVDVDAFNVKLLPAILVHVGQVKAVRDLAHSGLDRLKNTTAAVMDAILTIQPSDFEFSTELKWMSEVFKTLFSLCVRDDDMEIYKRVVRKWIFHHVFRRNAEVTERLRDIPYGQGYIMMAEIEQYIDRPTLYATNAMRPTRLSNFNASEFAVWITDLLRRIQLQHYPDRMALYKRLIQQCIFWAVSRNIAVEDIENLPYGRWYLWEATAAKWAAHALRLDLMPLVINYRPVSYRHR